MHWSHGKTLKQIKYAAIWEVLREHQWNRTRAAKALGMPIRTMRNYIKDMEYRGVKIPASGIGTRLEWPQKYPESKLES